ncbi:MAG: hypothetical protein KGL18_08380 [Burkholderiales bacterium]|nr:hypothetical protein [Burkholderiales bacterium]MDE1925897.1 hypothetical protein [Burkholderiales bacterium]MDE2502975.1 hypothetical protein [Burkholderiales bacterium]
MKRKVLSALLASAFVGIATNASAGVIQASYKNFAAEVFGSNVSLTAPTIGYSLALPLTGTAGNPNSFTVTYTLTNGATWNAAALPTATLIGVNGTDILAGAPGVISASNPSQVSYAFTLNSGITFPSNSTIVLGTYGANLGANGTISNVYTTLQTPALAANYCNPTPASIGVTIALTNAAGSPFDSNLASAINSTPILQSNTATTVTVASSSAFSSTVPALNEESQINVQQPSLGKFFTTNVPADITDGVLGTTRINLGSVTFGPHQSLYDTDGATLYTVANANWGVDAAGDGGVSENGATITVNATGGTIVTGGLFSVSSTPDCNTPLAGVTQLLNANSTSATITVPAASMNNAGLPAVGGSRTAYVCYTTNGTNVVPPAMFSLASGTLLRTTNSGELATPMCPGNLYNLTANGVQIDVRNYVPGIVTAANGWESVIRVINTDPSQSASPTAQVLTAGGALGASVNLAMVAAVGGKTGPFAPLEVRYYLSPTIDAALNAASAAGGGVTYTAPNDVNGNARLRIFAPTSSIRVQNYVMNSTGQFFEASGAQSAEGPSGNQQNTQNAK